MRYLALFLALFATVLLAACAEKGTGKSDAGTVVSWADVSSVFSSNCNACHTGPAAVTSLAYADLIADTTTTCGSAPNMIVPGSRATSCLYLVLTNTDGIAMGAAPYPPNITDLVGIWIDEGAPGP